MAQTKIQIHTDFPQSEVVQICRERVESYFDRCYQTAVKTHPYDVLIKVTVPPSRLSLDRMPMPKLVETVWEKCSEYNRRKPENFRGDHSRCCSCGKRLYWKHGHAGHFIATGTSGVLLKFHDRNIHLQCPACNLQMPKNKPITENEREVFKGYSQFMVWRYGAEIFDELEALIKEACINKRAFLIARHKFYTDQLRNM